jgi:glycosyltransferase involved in cell wall biosynthesis
MIETEVSQTLEAWFPIPIVQLNLNSPREPEFDRRSSRARVEVFRDGQIVGVFGTPVVNGRWAPNTIEIATRDYLGVATSALLADDARLPTITVVVPTIAVDLKELSRTIDSLLAMDYPRFDIVVVDNRATSGNPLPDYSSNERIRFVEESRPGISAARNRGIDVATGEIIAFTDDDVSVEPTWLRALGTCFALHPEVEGVGGLVMPRELDTQPQLWFEEFFGGFSRSFEASLTSLALSRASDPMFPYAPGRFGAGCNMAFRRASLERMGRFNLALGTGTPAKGGEDLAMFLELALNGATLAFEPAALVRHSHRRSEAAFMKQVFGYGVGLTAMYSALIARDPRRLGGVIARVPHGLRLLSKPRTERSTIIQATYPRRCHTRQLLGMAYGPSAYTKSIVAARRPV